MVCFGIVPAGLRDAVGLIQIRALDPSFALAAWGFVLGSAFWSSGVFEDAASSVLEFAFNVLHVHRLEARAVSKNARANGALQKLGAITEAVLAKRARDAGETVVYVKPVQTGLAPGQRGSDADFVGAAAGVDARELLRFPQPLAPAVAAELSAADFQISDSREQVRISGSALEAVIRKQGYVSGVAAGSFLDKKTGFHDAGFGLDIVDWLMEPGSDAAYRSGLDRELIYEFGNLVHGNIPKRSIEGPQVCTKGRELAPQIFHGKDFVAVSDEFPQLRVP